MDPRLESQVIKTLAVVALAAAFLAAAVITFNSGVFGGGAGGATGSEEALDAAVSASPAEAAGGEADEAPAAETTSNKKYTVQEGDSFYTISRQFNTSISEIQQLNPNLDPSNLTPGTTVIVP
jgi:LysM repeat protein